MKTSDYDYDLPPELIAQEPAERRDQSRLMVLDRATGRIEHRVFADVVEWMAPGDLVVVNETRVFPARLRGERAGGGEGEILLLHPQEDGTWTALARPGRKLREGKWLEISPELRVEVVGVREDGNRVVRLHAEGSVDEILERYGEVPLPPYVERAPTAADRERYQTVYARERGSVAAPTAGLHFTPELLQRIEAKGTGIARVTLHVGVGTFRPVETEDPAEHPMHREWYRLDSSTADRINSVREAGGAVWAVGTTTVRVLESSADEGGRVQNGEGWTDIFIRPPYSYRAVDRLITNFHLPRSTLLMLVSAFAGHELAMKGYREAVAAGYRFYSYGDAMAIL